MEIGAGIVFADKAMAIRVDWFKRKFMGSIAKFYHAVFGKQCAMPRRARRMRAIKCIKAELHARLKRIEIANAQ